MWLDLDVKFRRFHGKLLNIKEKKHLGEAYSVVTKKSMKRYAIKMENIHTTPTEGVRS
jgi:hypothetical protein